MRAVILIAFFAVAQQTDHTNEAVMTDARDGRRYPVVQIAGMSWLGQNLSYDEPGSSCPEGENNCAEGRLYPWAAAMAACPRGWHLSTEDEWQRLERHLGMSTADLTREKERGPTFGNALKADGSTGLAIPLSGWRRPDGSYVAGNGNDRAAALWTAGKVGEDEAWHRDLSSARSGIWRSSVPLKYSLSVRCVQDAR